MKGDRLGDITIVMENYLESIIVQKKKSKFSKLSSKYFPICFNCGSIMYDLIYTHMKMKISYMV